MKEKKLLIDGDILVYRMGFACQTRNKEVEPFNHAAHLVKLLVEQLTDKFKTHNIKIFLTANDKSNFRYKLAKTQPYKGNRDPAINPKAPGKPIHYDALREYILQKYNSEEIHDIEADDALGIAQCKLLEEGDIEPVMVSIDKDLDMIPGWHYNFVREELYEISDPGYLEIDKKKKKIRGGGLKWFYAQMLLGDSADYIPGITGYGPVKVVNELEHCSTEEEMYNTVKQIYEEELSDNIDPIAIQERFYEVADLLWMWRKENDCKSKELKEVYEK